MAVWRLKAHEMFGFPPGSYSYAHGVAELFADLRLMVIEALRTENEQLLGRIIEYVLWANEQDAENLRSAADIAFFIPLLRDAETRGELSERLRGSVLTQKLPMLG